MRSASRAGSVLASHNPPAGPITALTARNTHAAGQCTEPAAANSSAPMATTKMVFCVSSLAIMPGFRSPGYDRAVFGKLAALLFTTEGGEGEARPSRSQARLQL